MAKTFIMKLRNSQVSGPKNSRNNIVEIARIRNIESLELTFSAAVWWVELKLYQNIHTTWLVFYMYNLKNGSNNVNYLM